MKTVFERCRPTDNLSAKVSGLSVSVVLSFYESSRWHFPQEMQFFVTIIKSIVVDFVSRLWCLFVCLIVWLGFFCVLFVCFLFFSISWLQLHFAIEISGFHKGSKCYSSLFLGHRDSKQMPSIFLYHDNFKFWCRPVNETPLILL